MRIRDLFTRKPRKPVGSSSRSGGYFSIYVPSTGQRMPLKNIVPNVSLDYQNDLMSNVVGSSNPVFSGLIDADPDPTFDANDTMASHEWAEIIRYDEATRPAWDATASSGGVTTSDTVAEFTANNDLQVAGAFLVTNSTKDGSTGILIAEAAADGAPIAVPNGEVAQLTYTYTHTSG